MMPLSAPWVRSASSRHLPFGSRLPGERISGIFYLQRVCRGYNLLFVLGADLAPAAVRCQAMWGCTHSPPPSPPAAAPPPFVFGCRFRSGVEFHRAQPNTWALTQPCVSPLAESMNFAQVGSASRIASRWWSVV
eukprot:7712267-Pyramimonas_sp.AAC.1